MYERGGKIKGVPRTWLQGGVWELQRAHRPAPRSARELSQLCPVVLCQPARHFPAQPRRMGLTGNVPGEFLFVCLFFFASKCFSHSFAY